MKVPYGETRLLVVTRKPVRERYVTLGISLIDFVLGWGEWRVSTVKDRF
jgi:hypothetical protein